ncbi:MAG: hypothetical protein NC177_11720 [Ruminococcus flavefaciens]|nr:hypothetical protein [Ruminococcus flavefaciens]
MIKDVTETFRNGILNAENYHFKDIQRKLESLPDIWCMADHDSHRYWYYIGWTDGEVLTEYFGLLSRYFPVALLMKNCPDNVHRLLEENGIFTDDFSRRCSCDEEILKQYAPEDIHIIDDRKLLDGSISFDSWDFEIICSHYYTDPYDFDFYDII